MIGNNQKKELSHTNKFILHIQKYGLITYLRVGLVHYSKGVFVRIFKGYIPPSFRLLVSRIENVFLDPRKFIQELASIDESRLEQYEGEFSKIEQELATRNLIMNKVYPDNYAVERGARLILYALVRTERPEIFLETGVANGVSSFVILSAMRHNNKGKLISFDISENVGNLVTDDLKGRWELQIIRKPMRKEFLEKLAQIGNIDMFLHDSDHSYKWQKFEYKTALNHIKSGGFLLSDDIDSSYAFLELVRDLECKGYMLVDTRRVFGAIKVQH
ncbi:MAG: class I SAM-dependent methyltransferase [Conexivisphaerales archaeon]